MKLRLVSFAICPYVQRAVIALREKRVEHETTYIDLRQKPEWFLKISPRGKVPVLLADGRPIFESQAICEFLDEVCDAARLLPSDPFERARDRGWFQFAEDVLGPVYRRMYAKDDATFERALTEVSAAFEKLEQELAGRDFLSGDGTRFGMADVALAPALTKLGVLRSLGDFELPEGLPAVRAWGSRLMARDSIRGSIPDDYEDLTFAAMRSVGALLIGRVDAASGG